MLRPSKIVLVCGLSFLSVAYLTCPVARGDVNAGQLAPSLRAVPADVAFYTVMLRNREQFEAIAHSKAWTTFKGLPLVQALWHKVALEAKKPGTPIASLWQLYQLPENQQLLELLAEMGSQEVFICGDHDWIGFSGLTMELIGGARFGPALMQLSGQAGGLSPAKLQGETLLTTLSQNLDRIKIPELLIGFKIKDVTRAEAQLKRLDQLVQSLVQANPQLKGVRFKRHKAAAGEFLTLTLDGSMVPWQQFPFEDFEKEPGQFDKLRERLASLKMSLSVGLRDGYVLVSINGTGQPPAHLGQGSKLAEQPEFKRLTPFARNGSRRSAT